MLLVHLRICSFHNCVHSKRRQFLFRTVRVHGSMLLRTVSGGQGSGGGRGSRQCSAVGVSVRLNNMPHGYYCMFIGNTMIW